MAFHWRDHWTVPTRAAMLVRPEQCQGAVVAELLPVRRLVLRQVVSKLSH